MIGLNILFWTFVILFAIIGGMRGWAKEILVSFSAILALFMLTVLETYVPIVRNTIVASGGSALFWFRFAMIALLVFFGYQTPNITAIAGPRFTRERIQDTLLGVVMGALNGYLIFGSLWYFLHQANYPFPIIEAPPADTVDRLIGMMAPKWLVIPWVYFAIGVAFLFVVIVFI